MTLVTLAPRHVGWKVDGDVVASARMERDGESLRVVETSSDDVAALRDLFDAIVAAATAPRVTGDDPVLAECGFAAHGGSWVREVKPVTVPLERTAAVSLSGLEQAIRDSWSAETSSDPDGWTAENPAYQHCDVTARVVHDYLGGDVLVAGVVRDGRRVDRHAWNRLPSGLMIDLSREQFRAGEQFEAPSVVEEYVGETLAERYEVFAARVREKLDA